MEEELKDNSLAKDLKKINNQLDKILKKEKDLVELRLNESISMDMYQDKSLLILLMIYPMNCLKY